MRSQSTAYSSGEAIDEEHGPPSEEVSIPMAGLNEGEREIINRQLEAPELTIGYFALFRYANMNEGIIMVIALAASIAAGATMPLMTVRLLKLVSLSEKEVLEAFYSAEIGYMFTKPFKKEITLQLLLILFVCFISSLTM
jgi:hypothetical protein